MAESLKTSKKENFVTFCGLQILRNPNNHLSGIDVCVVEWKRDYERKRELNTVKQDIVLISVLQFINDNIVFIEEDLVV